MTFASLPGEENYPVHLHLSHALSAKPSGRLLPTLVPEKSTNRSRWTRIFSRAIAGALYSGSAAFAVAAVIQFVKVLHR